MFATKQQLKGQSGGTVRPAPLFFQAKLTVNHPGDAFEQEADAVADQVVQTPGPTAPFRVNSSAPAISPLQRKCADCEQEEETGVMRKAQSRDISAGQTAPPAVQKVLSATGRPLPENTRNFMEGRFVRDFSNVRIHTGGEAAASAGAIQAKAYTAGRDIVFNRGEFAPGTDHGRRLLAHELTHVVQQGGAGSPMVQRNSGAGGTATGSAAASSPARTPYTIGAACNRQDVVDIVTEALVWLDDIYAQLLQYDADEVFAGQITPGPDHARIAGAVQQAFNTTDLSYIEVIRRRFRHMAFMLRTAGRVAIDCSGPYCNAGGNSFTAAYVAGPNALTLCNAGTPGNRPIPTFIHEMAHAVIPQAGISNTVTATSRGVRDRAYRTDRVFQHLSAEETLDNADSYGVLAELLHSRSSASLVRQQADTTGSCTQPNLVLEAFARADQWHQFALHEMDTDLQVLQGAALSTLPQGNLDMLNRAFPNITTTAQLIDLHAAFQRLKVSGFDGLSSVDFECAGATDVHCGGTNAAFTYTGRVSPSAVTLRTIRTTPTVSLCPGWFGLSADDRIRTIYAAFLIGRPSWIVRGFVLADALKYVDGARSFIRDVLPAPTTGSAGDHIRSNELFHQANPGSIP